MQSEALPVISTVLKFELKHVLDKAIKDFKEVMEQFMKANKMQVSQITNEAELPFSTTTMEKLGTFFATALILPMAIWALVESKLWEYDTTMDDLAEEWATNFDQGTKFKLIYEVNKHYSQMVIDMEVKNEFVPKK